MKPTMSAQDAFDFVTDHPELMKQAAQQVTPVAPSPETITNAAKTIQPTGQLDYKEALSKGYMPSDMQSLDPSIKLVNAPDNLDTLNSNGDWDTFTDQAQRLAKLNDFPVGVLLGQAELESGKGQSGLTTGYNNYFGIKGSGSNGGVVMPTQEYDPNRGYYGENSQFAAYKSPADSIQAYVNLIKNEYGINATADSDPMQILQQIQSHGYATDPTYVDQVANTDSFKKFSS